MSERPVRQRHVFAVSDATGATCELVVQAALTQFASTEVLLERVPFVRSPSQIEGVLERAAAVHGVVVYTMAEPELRAAMLDGGLRRGVPTVDILGPILTRLSDQLEISPLSQPGLLRHLDADYFRRIESVEFTIQHDDGLRPETLDRAEIVLAGVSRTSKTPVSLYLSLRGWKVANVPLVAGVDPPTELFAVDSRRVLGFTIDPAFLRLIREERARHVGLAPRDAYVNEEAIRRELLAAERLFARQGWPVLNVTAKAIEETASEVMVTIAARTGDQKDRSGPG
ncbi:MAG: kinase/pyrophosphorylase [Acidobacteria bacterium]|jgi:hypothetical protein|nr:kinase/pyrophosphorylase [Acidobacteriota bacterium]MCU0254108.1 kinase/pyrophosphorylase [Acidobacteriota bacterium]